VGAKSSTCTTWGDDVVIGLETPLSAPGAVTYGQQYQRGGALGVEYVNTQMNGVLGCRKMVMKVADTQGQAEVGVAGYRRLVTEEHAVAIFGFSHSSVNLAVNEVAKELGVPTFGSQTSAAKITSLHLDIAFRTHVIDQMRAGTWLKLIKEKGWKKIAIMVEDTDYGVGLLNETLNQAKAQGLGLTFETVVVDHLATDMTPQLLKIKNFGPDVFIECNSAQQKDQIIDQAWQIGLQPTVPIVNSNDEPTASNFWSLHPKNGVGLMSITSFSPTTPLSLESQWMVPKYKALYNEDPIYASLNGFGQVIIIAQALNLAGTTESKALIKALETGTFDGWSSIPVTFPRADGVYWHNWSPPVSIFQFTEANQDWKKAPILTTYSVGAAGPSPTSPTSPKSS
jgi:branched-chain amino acid transport system substrate-binding protein